MVDDRYAAQVELPIRTLPYVAEEHIFALKGGATMDHRSAAITSGIRGVEAHRIEGGGGETRLQVHEGRVDIKIEASPVMRGVVHDPAVRMVSEALEQNFGFAEIQVVAFKDLFAGKLHAALDRQHPRDPFDVKLLYENEGLTDALFRTFVVYLASSGRPAHEILDPHRMSLDAPYAHEFQGMTSRAISLSELAAMREQLIRDIKMHLDEPAKRFLLTLHDTVPDFEAIGLLQAAELPAVRWKLLNLRKLIDQNSRKHAEQRETLKSLFDRT